MTTANWEQPLVSVDVVPIRLNKATRQIDVFLGRRKNEPYLGEFALPGVLLSPHERVNEAASRAITEKLEASVDDVRFVKDVGVADNPDRDPRGATLSIVHFAVLGDSYVANDNLVETVPLHDIKGFSLPFDHNTLVEKALAQVDAFLMVDKETSRAVLGDTFRTTDLYVAFTELHKVTNSPTGIPDLSNLSRSLKNSDWLHSETAPRTSTTKGRPASQWAWN